MLFLAAVSGKTTNPDGMAALLDTLFAASAGYLRDVFVEYQLLQYRAGQLIS